MNIRLFRSGSFPLWFSAPELNVKDTRHLHDIKYSERYVYTTHRLHELHMQGGIT